MLMLILSEIFYQKLRTEFSPSIYNIYIQIDGVVLGSPLGSVLANTFMVELESVFVPKLNNHVKNWRRFVNDTCVYVKRSLIEYVLSVLNSFRDNIKFTYE